MQWQREITIGQPVGGWLASWLLYCCPLAAVPPGHSHHKRPCCCCCGLTGFRPRWRMRCCCIGCTLDGAASGPPRGRRQGHCQRCACWADRSAPTRMSSGTEWLAKSLCRVEEVLVLVMWGGPGGLPAAAAPSSSWLACRRSDRRGPMCSPWSRGPSVTDVSSEFCSGGQGVGAGVAGRGQTSDVQGRAHGGRGGTSQRHMGSRCRQMQQISALQAFWVRGTGDEDRRRLDCTRQPIRQRAPRPPLPCAGRRAPPPPAGARGLTGSLSVPRAAAGAAGPPSPAWQPPCRQASRAAQVHVRAQRLGEAGQCW